MTLGVDDYLAWTPADMGQGAVWLRLKANDMEMTATAIRNFAADGTAGQCGAFIEARRTEAEDIAGRVQGLSDLLSNAATEVKEAGADLVGDIARLRDACTAIDEEGFERFDGSRVRDARTEYADEAERDLREQRAADLQDELEEHLREIRERDEQADRVLHGLVDRPVRDRTDKGNGNPFAIGISEMAGISATIDAGASLAEGHWKEAARNAARGLTSVRSLGPAAAVLGFAGGVAGRPEDEPLFEAIVAEGAGSVAAAWGAPVGTAIGFAIGGPVGSAVGGVGGALLGAGTSQWTASKVREWFDHEN